MSEKLDKTTEIKPKKKMNLFLKILLIIFIVILIIAISVIGFGYFFLKGKYDKIDYVDLNANDISINEGVTESLEEYRNIALLGLDAREDSFGTGNRSDCIMIISLNQKTKDVKITSIYRDTYLNIDGHGLDKVTHAYSYGGPRTCIKYFK